jgi:hypothetical protein
MMLRRTLAAALFGVVALGLTTSRVSWANGAEFFAAQQDGPPVLYYFGSIKDTSGNVLDKLMVTISVKNAGMNVPFRNDAPGHFRSPDIGKALKGLGKPVDPGQIEIKITKPGYKLVKSPAVPNKLGAVQLDLFVMEADSSAKGR